MVEPTAIKKSTIVWHKIDRICDAFEQALAIDPRRPRIEDQLQEVSEDDRSDLLFELLKLELEFLDTAGHAVSRESYHVRFPASRDNVDAAFAVIETTKAYINEDVQKAFLAILRTEDPIDRVVIGGAVRFSTGNGRRDRRPRLDRAQLSRDSVLDFEFVTPSRQPA